MACQWNRDVPREHEGPPGLTGQAGALLRPAPNRSERARLTHSVRHLTDSLTTDVDERLELNVNWKSNGGVGAPRNLGRSSRHTSRRSQARDHEAGRPSRQSSSAMLCLTKKLPIGKAIRSPEFWTSCTANDTKWRALRSQHEAGRESVRAPVLSAIDFMKPTPTGVRNRTTPFGSAPCQS